MSEGRSRPEIETLYYRVTNLLYLVFVILFAALVYYWYQTYVHLLRLNEEMSKSFSIMISPVSVRLNPLDWLLIGVLSKYGLLSLQLIVVALFLFSVVVTGAVLLIIHLVVLNWYLSTIGIDTISRVTDTDVMWDYLRRRFVIRSFRSRKRLTAGPTDLFWKTLYFSEFLTGESQTTQSFS